MPAAPQYCPSPRELDDLELLVTEALPGRCFNASGSAVTLTLPPEIEQAATAAGAVELVDPEGLPLATVAWPGGEVTPRSLPAYGPFRRLYLSPAQARERYAGRSFVAVDGPLSYAELDRIDALGPVVLLALAGHGRSTLSPIALIRATVGATDHLQDAEVVAVPLGDHGGGAAADEIDAAVLAAYSNAVLIIRSDEGELPASVASIIEFDQPVPDECGLVVFFTGLSGSGKSTLARALMDKILEQGRRTLTSLDGDVVRRNLSAGLTFSKEDRETNIRRIGWVAAEIARHRGVAVCSPIAPFDATRQDVRRYVEEAGGAFFLVHVATPLEECERRDRKGLYAKARAGEIPEFTGISSPYEEPADADVRVDTTGRSVDDALEDVLAGLRRAGYLDFGGDGHPFERGSAAAAAEGLNILFVCTANICRSAFMQVTATGRGLPGLRFDSAGTQGWVDYPLDAEMATVTPPSPVADAFRSKPLTPALLDWADLVLTAESGHRSVILDDHPAMVRKVLTLGQAAEALERIGAVAGRDELLVRLAAARGTATPDLDVPDPFRKGPAAARACAERIEALLDRVLPPLSRALAGPTPGPTPAPSPGPSLGPSLGPASTAVSGAGTRPPSR